MEIPNQLELIIEMQHLMEVPTQDTIHRLMSSMQSVVNTWQTLFLAMIVFTGIMFLGLAFLFNHRTIYSDNEKKQKLDEDLNNLKSEFIKMDRTIPVPTRQRMMDFIKDNSMIMQRPEGKIQKKDTVTTLCPQCKTVHIQSDEQKCWFCGHKLGDNIE